MGFTIYYNSAINDSVESDLRTLSCKAKGAYCVSDILKVAKPDQFGGAFQTYLKLRIDTRSFRGP